MKFTDITPQDLMLYLYNRYHEKDGFDVYSDGSIWSLKSFNCGGVFRLQDYPSAIIDDYLIYWDSIMK